MQHREMQKQVSGGKPQKIGWEKKRFLEIFKFWRCDFLDACRAAEWKWPSTFHYAKHLVVFELLAPHQKYVDITNFDTNSWHLKNARQKNIFQNQIKMWRWLKGDNIFFCCSYLIVMMPKDVLWRFGTELDDTSQIDVTAHVDVELGAAQNHRLGSWKRSEDFLGFTTAHDPKKKKRDKKHERKSNGQKKKRDTQTRQIW